MTNAVPYCVRQNRGSCKTSVTAGEGDFNTVTSREDPQTLPSSQGTCAMLQSLPEHPGSQVKDS